MVDIRGFINKILHRHEYVTLKMYPPRPKYFSHHWDFLLECECGHKKLAKLPGCIKEVQEVLSIEPRQDIVEQRIVNCGDYENARTKSRD